MSVTFRHDFVPGIVYAMIGSTIEICMNSLHPLPRKNPRFGFASPPSAVSIDNPGPRRPLSARKNSNLIVVVRIPKRVIVYTISSFLIDGLLG